MSKKKKSAIEELMCYPDIRLFEEISTGLKYILDNVNELDSAARELHEAGQYRSAQIIQNIAKEESGKFLMLMDAVRCPRDRINDTKFSKQFRDHIVKTIYADACRWRPNNLDDICKYISSDLRRFYLDGPNGIDWIIPNEITSTREGLMYVDYTRNLVDSHCQEFWTQPSAFIDDLSIYQSDTAVQLIRSLHRIGATTATGLKFIASIWRNVIPEKRTSVHVLRAYNIQVVKHFDQEFSRIVTDDDRQLIINNWLFLLWPMNIFEMQEQESIELLREKRENHISYINKVRSLRDPAPKITMKIVEQLNRGYQELQRAYDVFVEDNWQGSIGSLKIAPSIIEFELGSEPYKKIVRQVENLTKDERLDLLALGWFGDNGLFDEWPRAWHHARTMDGFLDIRYCVWRGKYWLAGMNRWQEEPQKFQTGQWYGPPLD